MADDFFAVLGEPRRPWLDPEEVKDRFHALSREQHPDQQAAGSNAETDAGFARLNQAHVTLRDPKTRLRHLLELEYPLIRLSGPASVPATLADLFAPIHGLVQTTDALLAKKLAAPSALAKALLAREETFPPRTSRNASRRSGNVSCRRRVGVASFRRGLGCPFGRCRRTVARPLPTFRLPLALDRPTPGTSVPIGYVTPAHLIEADCRRPTTLAPLTLAAGPSVVSTKASLA